MYGCVMYDTLFPPAWNDAPGSLSPQTEPEIMLTCWVCWVKYSWNSLTKSTGSVLISSISFHCNEPPKKMRGQEDVWKFRFHVQLPMTYNTWRGWPKHPNDDAGSLLLTTMLMPPCELCPCSHFHSDSRWLPNTSLNPLCILPFSVSATLSPSREKWEKWPLGLNCRARYVNREPLRFLLTRLRVRALKKGANGTFTYFWKNSHLNLAVATWSILERVLDNGIAESQCFCLNINDVDRNFVSTEIIIDSISKSGVK